MEDKVDTTPVLIKHRLENEMRKNKVLQTQMDDVNRKMQRLEKDVTDLRQLLYAYNERIEANQENSGQTIASIEQRYEKKVATVKQAFAKKIRSLELDNKAYRVDVYQLSGELASLKIDNISTKLELAELSKRVTGNNSHFKEVENHGTVQSPECPASEEGVPEIINILEQRLEDLELSHQQTPVPREEAQIPSDETNYESDEEVMLHPIHRKKVVARKPSKGNLSRMDSLNIHRRKVKKKADKRVAPGSKPQLAARDSIYIAKNKRAGRSVRRPSLRTKKSKPQTGSTEETVAINLSARKYSRKLLVLEEKQEKVLLERKRSLGMDIEGGDDSAAESENSLVKEIETNGFVNQKRPAATRNEDQASMTPALLLPKSTGNNVNKPLGIASLGIANLAAETAGDRKEDNTRRPSPCERQDESPGGNHQGETYRDAAVCLLSEITTQVARSSVGHETQE